MSTFQLQLIAPEQTVAMLRSNLLVTPELDLALDLAELKLPDRMASPLSLGCLLAHLDQLAQVMASLMVMEFPLDLRRLVDQLVRQGIFESVGPLTHPSYKR